MKNSVLRALWRKVHGAGITNPPEMTTLMRDLDKRLKRLEEAYEELAKSRPASDRDAGDDIPVIDPSDDGGRTEPKARSKGSAPRRGK